MEEILTKKDKKNVKKNIADLKNTVTMNIPKWALLLIFMFGLFAIVAIISMIMQAQRSDDIAAYNNKQYLETHTLREVQIDSMKLVWYNCAKATPLYILFLVIGLSFGLSKGIALVRVEK